MQALSDVLSAALSTTAPNFLCPFHWDGVEPAGRRPAGAARVGRGRGVAHKTAASSGRPSGPARRPPRRVRPSEPWCLAQAPDPEGGTMLTWDDLRSIDAISDPLGQDRLVALEDGAQARAHRDPHVAELRGHR